MARSTISCGGADNKWRVNSEYQYIAEIEAGGGFQVRLRKGVMAHDIFFAAAEISPEKRGCKIEMWQK
jgi:hypothetical protein